MPIYEYACLACGAEFEKLVQRPGPVACVSCESERVSRRLSLVGVKTAGRTSDASPAPTGGGGGGCCGGGCGCR
ncbi:MAG TPA: zinc ribbon domain-containing protein [Candidatus Limnocylindria bacterium]|jgi:putative FmdB family regulatory protein|nr:zinc ribbon domain-containing protein [Candidatus Limnocylindria bacterium]